MSKPKAQSKNVDKVLETILSPITYYETAITKKDSNTIAVQGIRGKPLTLIFERRLTGWRSELRITAQLDDSQPVRQINYYSGLEITQEIKEFWAILEHKAFEQQSKQHERDLQRVSDLLKGEPEDPMDP